MQFGHVKVHIELCTEVNLSNGQNSELLETFTLDFYGLLKYYIDLLQMVNHKVPILNLLPLELKFVDVVKGSPLILKANNAIYVILFDKDVRSHFFQHV